MANTSVAQPQSAEITVKPFQGELWDWQATGGITPIIVATPVLAKAAAGADLRNYVTSFEFSNSSATVTTISILDGAVVIWTGNLPVTTGQITVTLLTPLKGSLNTAVNLQCGTTAASVYWNIRGYLGI